MEGINDDAKTKLSSMTSWK